MTNYSYPEAAKALGCTESWLRETNPKRPLPHIKFGGGHGPVIFTDEHLEQIRQMYQVQPLVPHTLRATSRRRAS